MNYTKPFWAKNGRIAWILWEQLVMFFCTRKRFAKVNCTRRRYAKANLTYMLWASLSHSHSCLVYFFLILILQMTILLDVCNALQFYIHQRQNCKKICSMYCKVCNLATRFWIGYPKFVLKPWWKFTNTREENKSTI